jgi:hypothetical protein
MIMRTVTHLHSLEDSKKKGEVDIMVASKKHVELLRFSDKVPCGKSKSEKNARVKYKIPPGFHRNCHKLCR